MTTEFLGNLYGFATAELAAAGQKGLLCVIEVDVLRAIHLGKNGFDCNLLMVLPPSMDALRLRLAQRNSESPSELQARLEVAVAEVACIHENQAIGRRLVNDDFPGFFSQVVESLASWYPQLDLKV